MEAAKRSRVYIIRHGETDYNLEGRVQGHLDIELNENGRKQSQETALRFRWEMIDLIYSSDLKRANQTAEPIASVTGAAVTTDCRLREMNFGVFEGLEYKQVLKDYAYEYASYRNGNPDFQIPSGESRRQKNLRVASFIADRLTNCHGQNILIVAHGGVLYDFFIHAFRIPLNQYIKLHHKNCSLNIFIVQDNQWMLSQWGDIGHLSTQPKGQYI